MPVVLHQFGQVGANNEIGYYVALELARHCVEQHELQRIGGPGGGIADGTCWAAAAVDATQNWPAPRAVDAAGVVGAGLAVLPYSMFFGVSTLARINNMVPVPGAGVITSHAERVALTNVADNNLALYTPANGGQGDAVLFVQLAPCPSCAAWLDGNGGGAANPYNFSANAAATLHVWYRWDYPGGVPNWTLWQADTRANKLQDINANW